MKKILLASTALVGFAGAAAAEVSLSGYAEIGIFGGSGGAAPEDAQFHSDLDVTFKLSGTSDSGFEFGASIDLDEVGDDANAAGGDPISHNGRGSGVEEQAIWVSGSFGKVTLGDTDGAFDWALSEVYMGTAINDDHSTHAGAYWFTGLDGSYDGQVMRYEYSFGDFAAALSAELDDTGTGDAALGLGVKWSGDLGGMKANAGLGYQDNGSTSVWGVSAGADMTNGISVKLGYADMDMGATTDTWFGVGLGYTTGALLVQANYGEYDSGADGWGLVANYDLGGGAVAMLGYGSGNAVAGNGAGEDTYSIGLGLSF
ncbi:MAG: porin [Rhodobacteraceae bacterium]|nr:porin [Paracoccaceae bacterium]